MHFTYLFLVLGLASRHHKETKRFLKGFVDILAIGAQATGFFMWPIVEFQNESFVAGILPVALFLTSAGWWENYVDRRSPLEPIRQLGRIKDRLKKTRYYVYFFISVWKIILFFSAMLLFLHLTGHPIQPLFSEFKDSFQPHELNVTRVLDRNTPQFDFPGGEKLEEFVKILSVGSTPVYVLLIQIASAYFAYIFGKFACKICIQGFSFAFPVNLTIPVVVSLLISACGLRNGDPCFFKGSIPDYLYWKCPNGDFLNDFCCNIPAVVELHDVIVEILETDHFQY